MDLTEELEFKINHPKTGAFGTINPTIEIRELIKTGYWSCFGLDKASAYRWLNNRFIAEDDKEALEAFRDCPEYSCNYHK